MAKTNDIPMQWLRECLIVDRKTGALYWTRRPIDHFTCTRAWNWFNNRCAGQRADVDVYQTNGYRRVRVMYQSKKIAISAHRIVFALTHGQWPMQEVDHIDRNRLNNAPDNLRDVDRSTNVRNRASYSRRRAA